MRALEIRPTISDMRGVGTKYMVLVCCPAFAFTAAYLTGEMLNELGRLGQLSLHPAYDTECAASGAVRLTRRDVGESQRRRRGTAIAPVVVTKGLGGDGKVVAASLRLARARHGSKAQQYRR